MNGRIARGHLRNAESILFFTGNYSHTVGDSMKSCPTCNRTFADSMSFCLVDGSILSAPFELRVDEDQATSRNNPARTEMFQRTPSGAEAIQSAPDDRESTPPPTVASPGALPRQTEAASNHELKPSFPETAASQPAIRTMKAPLPDVIQSPNQRGEFSAHSPQADSRG